jgi:hypothetical protein
MIIRGSMRIPFDSPPFHYPWHWERTEPDTWKNKYTGATSTEEHPDLGKPGWKNISPLDFLTVFLVWCSWHRVKSIFTHAFLVERRCCSSVIYTPSTLILTHRPSITNKRIRMSTAPSQNLWKENMRTGCLPLPFPVYMKRLPA